MVPDDVISAWQFTGPELIAEYLQLLATMNKRIPSSLLGCYDAQLLHPREFVLQMPVVGDLSVLHAIDVNYAEANLATASFRSLKLPVKCPAKLYRTTRDRIA